MALPAPHRLHQRQDFDALYRQGRRFSASYFLVRVLRDPLPRSDRPVSSPPKPPRIAVVVSQKVSKRAVVRNRIRRQVQGAIHHLLPQLPPGLRLLITARPPAVACNYYEFLQELKQLLSNAEVFHGYP